LWQQPKRNSSGSKRNQQRTGVTTYAYQSWRQWRKGGVAAAAITESVIYLNGGINNKYRSMAKCGVMA